MRVFISYTQESSEHQVRVWNVCEALRKEGIECVSDHGEFSPPEGWPQWYINQDEESQFVLVVCTETYRRRCDGKEQPGKGLGATWEGHVITQRIYAAGGRNTKYIPVVFCSDDRQYIPPVLQTATYYDLSTSNAFENLLRHITNQPAWIKSPVASSIRSLPPVERIQQFSTNQSAPVKLSQTGPASANLMVNVFDGTRQPVRAGTKILLRVLDGNQKRIVTNYYTVPSILFSGLPIYDNFGDNYTVVVSADGYNDTGFTPIRISPRAWQSINLMLLPNNGTFNFRDALWATLKQTHPSFATLLAQGAADDNAAQARYSQLMENQPGSLASFLNIATAISAINLPVGTPLDYIKGVTWDDTFAQDRFFGWADPEIIHQIITATAQGEFAPELDPAFFHGTATRSWKQIQFGEANVQLTFHEKDPANLIDGVNCVKIEADFSYCKDPGAHIFLEVVLNAVSHTLTNPKQVYALRWIAGRRAGVPEFNPPYVIA